MKHINLFDTESSFFAVKETIDKPWVCYTKDTRKVYYSSETYATDEEANYVYISYGYSLNDIDSAFGAGENTRLDYTDTYEYDGRTFYKFNISAEIEGQRVILPEDEIGFVIFANRNFGRLSYPYSVESYFVAGGETLPISYLSGGIDIYGFATEQEGSTVIIEHHDTSSLDKNGADYVDLGLPSGTLWATMNVGANSTTEYGKYFQWGDTEGYYDNEAHNFNWNTYKYGDGSDFTKYNTGENGYGGTIDNKVTLDLSDDAVHTSMGGDWKMPSYSQFAELYNATNNEWVEDYEGSGVNGRLFTSKTNGNSIFIPASGHRWDSSVSSQGYNAYLWSSSLYMDSPYSAWLLYFDSDDIYVGGSGRGGGFCVRGVL